MASHIVESYDGGGIMRGRKVSLMGKSWSWLAFRTSRNHGIGQACWPGSRANGAQVNDTVWLVGIELGEL
jgi:hypothetical protein